MLEPGASVDHYRILSLVGRGGMGEVYLAEDTTLRRKVALKFLRVGSVDRNRLRRFAGEARTASSLNHPNILTIYEIGGADAVPYIVTEFIEGVTLRERLRAGRLALSEALDLAMQIAGALAAAHHAGVVHRDIKPENVMVRNDGYAKILDFGLAKLHEREAAVLDSQAATLTAAETQTGVILGTPQYMSPEQVRGLELDDRTDIFSLGIVLYETVEGKAAFSGSTTADLMAAIVTTEPLPLTRGPDELQRIVLKALAKDRYERYQTAAELLADLKRLKSNIVAPARPLPAARWGRKIATLAALLVVVAGAIWFFAGRTRGLHSLAVLPFTNVSGDPNLEYLSEGINESLINTVSQLPELKIMARNLVLRYKSRDVDYRTLARELGVQGVLTGRVLQRGDALSISVELVDARDNSHVWGKHYDRKLADILAVQDEIVKDISERLRLKLSGEDKKRLIKRDTEDVEAYQLYLQACYQQNKRTNDSLLKSVAQFQQAIAKDSNFARAYAGLADSYTYLGNHAFMPPHQASPRAKSAVLKALELDDSLAEAHTALAYIRMDYDWDWAGATKSFERAIALNPGYTKAHSLYACVHTAQRRPDQALAEMNRALAPDPFSIYDNINLGWHLMMARRYDDALAQLRKTLEVEPNEPIAHEWAGLIYEQKGMLDQAIAELQKSLELTGNHTSTTAAIGHAYALANRRDEARNLLNELRRSSRLSYVSSYDQAILLMGLGQDDQAIASLQTAVEEHDGRLPIWGNVDPRLDRLRRDQRFKELMRRIGLPP